MWKHPQGSQKSYTFLKGGKGLKLDDPSYYSPERDREKIFRVSPIFDEKRRLSMAKRFKEVRGLPLTAQQRLEKDYDNAVAKIEEKRKIMIQIPKINLEQARKSTRYKLGEQMIIPNRAQMLTLSGSSGELMLENEGEGQSRQVVTPSLFGGFFYGDRTPLMKHGTLDGNQNKQYIRISDVNRMVHLPKDRRCRGDNLGFQHHLQPGFSKHKILKRGLSTAQGKREVFSAGNGGFPLRQDNSRTNLEGQEEKRFTTPVNRKKCKQKRFSLEPLPLRSSSPQITTNINIEQAKGKRRAQGGRPSLTDLINTENFGVIIGGVPSKPPGMRCISVRMKTRKIKQFRKSSNSKPRNPTFIRDLKSPIPDPTYNSANTNIKIVTPTQKLFTLNKGGGLFQDEFNAFDRIDLL